VRYVFASWADPFKREGRGSAADWERPQQIGHAAEVNRTDDRADEGVAGTLS
jgi:hypothetical protein